MKWKIIDTGAATAEENMALDRKLLHDLPQSQQPLLHLYEWVGPSVTYGHFLNPYDYLEKKGVDQSEIHLAKRPTGGGIVFHFSDFAYSILVPAAHPRFSVNTLENYAFVNQMIAKVLQEFMGVEQNPCLLQFEKDSSHPHAKYFCMAKPTLYDVMWNGKKVVGGAQRRTKHGFLHQGTISLELPPEPLIDALLKSRTLKPLIWDHSCQLLGAINQKYDLREASSILKNLLIKTFERKDIFC